MPISSFRLLNPEYFFPYEVISNVVMHLIVTLCSDINYFCYEIIQGMSTDTFL